MPSSQNLHLYPHHTKPFQSSEHRTLKSYNFFSWRIGTNIFNPPIALPNQSAMPLKTRFTWFPEMVSHFMLRQTTGQWWHTQTARENKGHKSELQGHQKLFIPREAKSVCPGNIILKANKFCCQKKVGDSFDFRLLPVILPSHPRP